MQTFLERVNTMAGKPTASAETTMDLILWRHAEAEDGSPDAKRKLTARGRKQAKQIARWLKPRLPADARIVVSPALRAVQTAEALATLDVLAGLAELAAERNYCRPELREEPILEAREGRHPVLDQALPPATEMRWWM